MGFLDFLKAFFKSIISLALFFIIGLIIIIFAISMMLANSASFQSDSLIKNIMDVVSFILFFIGLAFWFYAYHRYHHSIHIRRANYDV